MKTLLITAAMLSISILSFANGNEDDDRGLIKQKIGINENGPRINMGNDSILVIDCDNIPEAIFVSGKAQFVQGSISWVKVAPQKGAIEVVVKTEDSEYRETINK